MSAKALHKTAGQIVGEKLPMDLKAINELLLTITEEPATEEQKELIKLAKKSWRNLLHDQFDLNGKQTLILKRILPDDVTRIQGIVNKAVSDHSRIVVEFAIRKPIGKAVTWNTGITYTHTETGGTKTDTITATAGLSGNVC